METNLTEKIKTKKAKIAVIGLGHVGLPTASVFADAGFHVTGVDVRKEVVAIISSGKSHIKEPKLGELVEKVVQQGRLEPTTNVVQAIKEADIVIISVQTPIAQNHKPNMSYLKTAFKAVAKGLAKGKLVVLQSTVPPRATKTFTEMLEKQTNLRCGNDFWLAHTPERLTPGRAIQEFIENIRLIGGHDKNSTEVAIELFKTATKGRILATDCTTAEIAKLAENTFRDVNIAFANELALICENLGADVTRVIKLANTHPRVNIHNPGSGVGGPCLPKDPYLLLYSVKGRNFKSKVIKPSRDLNNYMPRHTINLVVKAFTAIGRDIEGSKIAVLGTAYKGQVSDTANSPSEEIIHRLTESGGKVVAYDPYAEESFGAEKASSVTEAVRSADCILVATDHKVFEKLELNAIKSLMKKNPIIIDGKRIIEREKAEREGFIYFGIGSV